MSGNSSHELLARAKQAAEEEEKQEKAALERFQARLKSVVITIIVFIFLVIVFVSNATGTDYVKFSGIAVVVVVFILAVGFILKQINALNTMAVVAIVITTIVAGVVIWFGGKLFDFMSFDKTPTSPILTLLLFVSIGIGTSYISVPREEGDRKLYFKKYGLRYLGWINMTVFVYSLLTYHFHLWLPNFVSATILFFIVSVIYKRIKLKDVGSRKKHNLLQVMMSPKKGVYIWLSLLSVFNSILVPFIIIYNSWGSLWHLTVNIGTYVSVYLFCMFLWKKFVFNDSLDVSALPNTSVWEVRVRHEVRRNTRWWERKKV